MPNESTESKPRLNVLFSVIIVDLIGFGIVLPILPFWADRFGASGLALGALLASHAAMQFLLAPTWGRLSDRIGRRPVMLITIAGTAVALAALGLAESLPAIFLARIMAGAFGANISVATAYITDVTDEADRTRWMGMVGASFAVGFTLGPPIGGLLAGVSHGAPMFFAAGLAAVNLVWAALRLVEPSHKEQIERASAIDVNRFSVLRDAAVRRLCLVYFLYSVAVTQLETTFAYFMLHRFGYRELGVALLMFAMAVLMGGIQGGAMRRLAKRYPERSLAICGLAVMTVAFLFVPRTGSVGLLLIPLAALAIGRAITQPPLMSLASMEAAEDARGIVMGVFQSSASAARIGGPLLAGALYDAGQAWPFVAASALGALAGVLALGIRIAAPADPAPEHPKPVQVR